MIKRIALTLLLIAALLAGCAPNVILLTPRPGPTSTITLTPVPPTLTPIPTIAPPTQVPFDSAALKGLHLTLWHGLDGTTTVTLLSLATEFSQKNEWGIKLDVVSQNNLNLLVQATGDAFSTPTPQKPDIVLALPEDAQGWDAKGLVTDLTAYILHPKLGLSTDEIKDIPAAFWKQGQVGKKRLSIPAMRSGRFLFYNVSFAKSLGFTAPPASADDFSKQACASNAFWKNDADLTNDRFGGLIFDELLTDIDAPWTAYAWLRSQGSDVFTDGNFSFTTPENQSALNFLADLSSRDCARFSLPDDPSNYTALAQRTALFVAGSLTNLRAQRAAFAGLSDEWTVIPFPGVTPTIPVYGPDFVVLKSDDAHQWAAWLFTRWMLAPEQQLRWSRETGTFPMRASVMDKLNIRSANPQWAAAFDLLPQAKTYPQSAIWSKARLVLGDGFFQLFQLNPTANNISQTLKMMDDTVNDFK